MKYSKIIRYNGSKDGFTLVELLAVILILSLILSIVLGVINVVRDDVDNALDEATKNIILDAANEYALEFRGDDMWKEEVKINANGKEEVSFCISLDSMIEQGYFKNDGSNYENYRYKYVVKATIVDGIYEYELDEIIDVNDCM